MISIQHNNVIRIIGNRMEGEAHCVTLALIRLFDHCRTERSSDHRCSIGRVVIDDDNLKIVSLLTSPFRGETPNHVANALLLVVTGDQYTNLPSIIVVLQHSIGFTFFPTKKSMCCLSAVSSTTILPLDK